MPGATVATAAPGGVGRGLVVEIQRARMVAAMSELVRERGVVVVTVGHVVERAGVSRRTFYDLFEDREDCLRAAFEYAIDRAAAAVLPVYGAVGGVWEERVRAGLAALLEFLDAERTLGRLCVVDALAAGPVVLERRAGVVDALVDVVHRGGMAARRERTTPRGVGESGAPGGSGERRPARIVAEGVVGAVLGVVHARLTAVEERPVAGLQRQLMGMIVLPYLGPQAAQQELARTALRGRRPARHNGDPLRGLEIRLTYRTVRVLQAIAQLSGRGPSPSGREVADAAGVQDQGQISKLLSRLEHLGLIVNEAVAARGAANAWTLTPRGREVERTIHTQAGD